MYVYEEPKPERAKAYARMLIVSVGVIRVSMGGI